MRMARSNACNPGARGEYNVVDDQVPTAPFHIQATPEVAGIPKLVLKHEESFFVSDRSGDFPAHFEGELGFYHRGTRHLRWLEVRLAGARPLCLSAEVSPENDQILVGLTNADIEGPDGVIPRNTIYLDRLLSLGGPALVESFTISSYHDAPCELALEMIFSADFHDVFEVRGTHRPARGHLLGEERGGGTVVIRYRGLDDVVRLTRLEFSPAPLLVASNRAVWRLPLVPGESRRVEVTVTASSSDQDASTAVSTLAERRANGERLPTQATRVETDHEAFNVLMARSLADLEMLLTRTDQGRVPYAGVPWYVAPFGRDSVITAMQLLPFEPSVAAATLRFLAARQGRVLDPFRDEEPGKILHEYRQGEMANCREIPFVPYYGTIDATPLWIMLLAEYVRWTADVPLARELWPHVLAGLAWMREHGDRDRDGYLEYETRSPLGLGNQGWKDSEDAVMYGDGRLAEPPIALAEVQGYAYAALFGAASVARALGDDESAANLRMEAALLRIRFNKDFWLEHEGFYALALDGAKRPCDVIASNVGHCLWTGILDEGRVATVAKRLLSDDMFSGWGIRTLSARERRYNPMSYHNGSVWPHDNAIAAAGFRRARLPSAVVTVASALFDASRCFEHARLPELFCGFPRHPMYGPISYPGACSPQAWASGAALQLLTALIGIEPDAVRQRITFHTPVLPPWLKTVELYDLRVGRASLDLGVSRGRDGASVELIGRRGEVELIVRR
jgi:glycogen debranching enzyme